MGTFVSSNNFVFFQGDPTLDALINFGATGDAGTTTDGEDDTTFEAGDPITFTITSGAPGTYVGALSVDLVGGGSDLLPVIFEDAFFRVLIPVGKTAADYVAPNFTSEAVLLSALDTATELPVCFGSGARVATPQGSAYVEALCIGDAILTHDGRAVAVKWVGRQTLVPRFSRLRMIRVAEGALGDGLPLRDLVLTADHALMLDGVLVNAGALVNGTTVIEVAAADLPGRVTVYHIETETHDIILAEGTPAETFIDYVGRQAFDNYAEYVALYGADRDIVESPAPRITAARHLPAAIRARLGIACAA